MRWQATSTVSVCATHNTATAASVRDDRGDFNCVCLSVCVTQSTATTASVWDDIGDFNRVCLSVCVTHNPATTASVWQRWLQLCLSVYNVETGQDRITFVLITNIKWQMGFQRVPKSVTLNDLERRDGRCFALFYRIRQLWGPIT